jgi:hypothetical protein
MTRSARRGQRSSRARTIGSLRGRATSAWLLHLPEEPDRYPGGNEPGFQTLFIEALAAAAARPPASSDTEAQALRTGIETIIRAFGTNSAEWAQQFRALLERVPVARRSL